MISAAISAAFGLSAFDPTQGKAIAYTKWADRTPEDQAQSLAKRAELAKIDQRFAEADRLRAADAKGHEVWNRRAPNVSALNKEQSLDQIEYMSELIQSGEADKLPLVAANGNQTTANYRQYVYWLKEHVKQLDGAPAGTDVKA